MVQEEGQQGQADSSFGAERGGWAPLFVSNGETSEVLGVESGVEKLLGESFPWSLSLEL